MSKSEINGATTNAIFKLIRTKSRLFNAATGLTREVPWNFTKFVVNSDLTIVEYFNPRAELDEVDQSINSILQ